jgi:HEAT repeat protein
VELLGAGSLIGGRGLPQNASEVRVQLGNVRAKPLTGPADELLAIMEDPNNPNHARAVEAVAELKLDQDEATMTRLQERLRRLVGTGPTAARVAAVRAIGRSRDLDQVPTLIFALSDREPEVVEAAHDALKFISRKLTDVEPLFITSEVERRAAIDFWKSWFRSVRPAAEFEN